MKRNPIYKELCEEWEELLVRKKVGEFKKKWSCLKHDDKEDLVQECVIHWFFMRDRYDKECGANRRTFMSNVIDNKLHDLVRSRRAIKRKTNLVCISLEDPCFEQPDAPKREDRESCDGHQGTVQVRLDISSVIERLSPLQQEICALLSIEGLSHREIGRRLGKHHDTVSRQIAHIRATFEKENFEKYLKK